VLFRVVAMKSSARLLLAVTTTTLRLLARAVEPRWLPRLAMLLVATGCVNQAEIDTARTSVYDTDFAIVFDAVTKAVRENYPNFDDSPKQGTIKTAWHQVKFTSNNEDPRSAQLSSSAQGFSNGNQTVGAGTTARGVDKRYFVRFDITVVGGRPWRVRVMGRASEWEPGMAVPTDLAGAAVPGWLPGRIDAMTVAVYRRLRGAAIKQTAPEVQVVKEDRTDPSIYSNVPPDAAKALAEINDAIRLRDFSRLRPLVDKDVVWSLGAPPSAETALVMWQADPSLLEAMQGAIAKGCGAVTGASDVVCPIAASKDAAFLGPRLRLSARSAQWRVTEFVVTER
jgi:hypothetical protein